MDRVTVMSTGVVVVGEVPEIASRVAVIPSEILISRVVLVLITPEPFIS